MSATAFLAEGILPPTSWSPMRDCVYRAANRVAALLLIVLFAPLFIVIAIAIWRADGLPVVYAHRRLGRDARLFRCFKFRTMIRNGDAVLAALLARDPAARAAWERDRKLENDPRVTPIGVFLRRTSLDELPQLFNVLRGEMALVGPRPITVEELHNYGRARWHYLRVDPGMTGLWQTSGRSRRTYAERVALDRHYVERRSLALDLLILLRTVRVVLQRDGAH